MRIWHAQCAFIANCRQSSSFMGTRTMETHFSRIIQINNNQQFGNIFLIHRFEIDFRMFFLSPFIWLWSDHSFIHSYDTQTKLFFTISLYFVKTQLFFQTILEATTVALCLICRLYFSSFFYLLSITLRINLPVQSNVAQLIKTAGVLLFSLKKKHYTD